MSNVVTEQPLAKINGANYAPITEQPSIENSRIELKCLSDENSPDIEEEVEKEKEEGCCCLACCEGYEKDDCYIRYLLCRYICRPIGRCLKGIRDSTNKCCSRGGGDDFVTCGNGESCCDGEGCCDVEEWWNGQEFCDGEGWCKGQECCDGEGCCDGEQQGCFDDCEVNDAGGWGSSDDVAWNCDTGGGDYGGDDFGDSGGGGNDNGTLNCDSGGGDCGGGDYGDSGGGCGND